jgi:ketosteroid isomerase-like protein
VEGQQRKENAMAKSEISDKLSDAVERVKNAATGNGDEREKDERDAGIEGRVAIVRDSLRALGEGEIDRFLEALTEDVEWVAPEGSKFPGSGTHRGRDAVRKEFFEEIQSGFPAFGYRPAHYLETDEEELVVTLGSFVGEGSSGEFDVPGVVVWEFDEQAITRVRIHSDSDAFPEPVKEEEKERDDEPKAEAEQPGGESESEGDEDEGPDANGDEDESEAGGEDDR